MILQILENNKLKNLFIVLVFAILIAILFALFSVGIANLRSSEASNKSFITVSGEGEVKAEPDNAKINLTIRTSAPQVKDAQNVIDEKAKKLNSELEKIGIEKQNIKSLFYNTNPKYEYKAIECKSETVPCGSEYKMVGYEASQTIEIKVKKIELTDKIISLAGTLEINEISGPNFNIENDAKFKSEARNLAIKNSRVKAESIAKALGMKLGKVVKFDEDANMIRSVPMMAYAKAAMSADGAAENQEVLQKGEEVIKSRVSVTYYLK